MASDKTSNFGLNQWAAEDAVLREDFNADNAKIDAALANCGNCRIVTGTYTGNGKYGASNPNKLTFDSTPLLLFVSAQGGGFSMWCGYGDTFPTVTYGSNQINYVRMTWGDASVSWYNDNYAPQQMNTADTVYRYMALIVTRE